VTVCDLATILGKQLKGYSSTILLVKVAHLYYYFHPPSHFQI